jgi:hypothetical protein
MIREDQVKAFLQDAIVMMYQDIEDHISHVCRGEQADNLIKNMKAIVDYRIGVESLNLDMFLAKPWKWAK